jgi:hypothetical protein
MRLIAMVSRPEYFVMDDTAEITMRYSRTEPLHEKNAILANSDLLVDQSHCRFSIERFFNRIASQDVLTSPYTDINLLRLLLDSEHRTFCESLKTQLCVYLANIFGTPFRSTWHSISTSHFDSKYVTTPPSIFTFQRSLFSLSMSGRTFFVGGNWKANPTALDAATSLIGILNKTSTSHFNSNSRVRWRMV